jgi:hypothetical protein
MARAQPVVRHVAVVERVLGVGELARHRRAQEQLGRADLDRVAEALVRPAVLQVGGKQVPDGVAIGLHQEPDHLFHLMRFEPACGWFLRALCPHRRTRC